MTPHRQLRVLLSLLTVKTCGLDAGDEKDERKETDQDVDGHYSLGRIWIEENFTFNVISTIKTGIPGCCHGRS